MCFFMKFVTVAAVVLPMLTATADAMPSVTVRAEVDVYAYVPPDNGSGPMWSYGCTTVVRLEDDVLVSQMVTGEHVPKLSNTRWRLLRRDGDKWTTVAEAEAYRQREPVVLATFDRQTVLVNLNDSIMRPGVMYGPTKPHLLRFAPTDSAPLQRYAPVWAGQARFTDHSYRGFAADATRHEILMMNIDADTGTQNWCYMNAAGDTLANGQITFPIRSCYPQVALRDGAGYVLAIGDIVEPVKEWREYKHAQTGRSWDYVFRILYFAAAPHLTTEGFYTPIEIANVDATAGAISNQDLWIGPDGAAWIMYVEREVQSDLMRDRFFPGKSVQGTLHLAIVRDGRVAERRVLMPYTESEEASWARFHETPDGRLYALVAVNGPKSRNVLMRVNPASDDAPSVEIPFTKPFGSFFLANTRSGCAPSNTMDIFGHASSGTVLSYAEVELSPLP